MKKLFLLWLLCGFFSIQTSWGQQADSVERKQNTEELGTFDQIGQSINNFFGTAVSYMEVVLFVDPFAALGMYEPSPIYNKDGSMKINPDTGEPVRQGIPLVVVWLVLSAFYFTIRMKFVNIRALRHSIGLVSGKYDDPNNKHGEVSHFQALATALSGTVGLGNIASVAIAVAAGGPGATFWLIVAGFLGMSSKFIECTLGVKYRQIGLDGTVYGGPMYYLSQGLSKRRLGGLGKFLAVFFAILCIGGSFGGGNMFQANQAYSQVATQFGLSQGYGLIFGIVMAIIVGVVIIGGIKSIAKVTDKLVPFMCGVYVLAALIVLIMNFTLLDDVFGLIFSSAFSNEAMYGGFLGTLVQGFKRSAFSNEAGVGSASIAHAAAKTEHPVSEGLVALLEPLIDTVIICTMTSLVIIVTGAYQVDGLEGSQMTSFAFGSQISWFPAILTVAVLMFAFSTMVSWSYYGSKAWAYLFGRSKGADISYKFLFLIFVIVGSSVEKLGPVVDFSDMMILGMAFPNIVGLIFLSNEVYKDLSVYMHKVKIGEIRKFK